MLHELCNEQVIVDLPAKLSQGERKGDIDTGLWSPLIDEPPVATPAYTGVDLTVDGHAHKPARAKAPDQPHASSDVNAVHAITGPVDPALGDAAAQSMMRSSARDTSSQMRGGALRSSGANSGAPYVVGHAALQQSTSLRASRRSAQPAAAASGSDNLDAEPAPDANTGNCNARLSPVAWALKTASDRAQADLQLQANGLPSLYR